MSDRVVTIGFTEIDYIEIEAEAKSKGLSVTQYCKSRIKKSEFDIKYEELIERVKKLEPDTPFTVKSLWKSDEWKSISKGVRLSLGRNFYKNVATSIVVDVKVNGMLDVGIMCYVKI